jgi:hypothetical protein
MRRRDDGATRRTLLVEKSSSAPWGRDSRRALYFFTRLRVDASGSSLLSSWSGADIFPHRVLRARKVSLFPRIIIRSRPHSRRDNIIQPCDAFSVSHPEETREIPIRTEIFESWCFREKVSSYVTDVRTHDNTPPSHGIYNAGL